mmetsp:Transcript_2961/g.11997  ORF Transcript_2961/g.11997 Transcript_2961/m.11997 type:complete len:248 (+) Transcript_2961:4807-5550(+)
MEQRRLREQAVSLGWLLLLLQQHHLHVHNRISDASFPAEEDTIAGRVLIQVKGSAVDVADDAVAGGDELATVGEDDREAGQGRLGPGRILADPDVGILAPVSRIHQRVPTPHCLRHHVVLRVRRLGALRPDADVRDGRAKDRLVADVFDRTAGAGWRPQPHGQGYATASPVVHPLGLRFRGGRCRGGVVAVLERFLAGHDAPGPAGRGRGQRTLGRRIVRTLHGLADVRGHAGSIQAPRQAPYPQAT